VLCHFIESVCPTENKDDYMKYSFYAEPEHIFDPLPRYHMKILLGDFKSKIQVIGYDSLHEAGNNNWVRVVNFAISTNLIVKGKIFPHCDIHKRTWICPDGVTHRSYLER
jgi:hypothetical protein